MIQSAINSLLSTTGKALAFAEAKKIADAKGTESAKIDTKIQKKKKSNLGTESKILKEKKKQVELKGQLRTESDPTRRKELQMLISASNDMMTKLAIQKASRNVQIQRLQMKKGNK